MCKYPRNVSKFICNLAIFHMKIFGLEIGGMWNMRRWSLGGLGRCVWGPLPVLWCGNRGGDVGCGGVLEHGGLDG